MIKAGDTVTIKAEWQDAGDDLIQWVAIEDEDGGRVKIQAQLGLAINPVQVVKTSWLES